MPTIFWSWQSDRSSRETRGLIRDALADAIRSLASTVEDAARPDDEKIALDHDTKDVGGSPDIAATILRKIEAATAFVADVTPIAISSPDDGKRAKHVANPNVLIELGYAKRALGPERIIQVWNTAFTGCGPDDLPFDMRGRRGPIAFHLPEGAPKSDLKAARETLTRNLQDALEIILRSVSIAAPAPLPWRAHREGDPSVWFPAGHTFLINEPDHGAGSKTTPEAPTSFVRILPTEWKGSDDVDLHDTLLWSGGGFSWGDTSDGILTYPGSVIVEQSERVHALTIRFPRTGEIWAIRRSITAEWEGLLRLDASGVTEGWARYLRYTLPDLIGRGGTAPISVRVGVSGIKGLHWPGRSFIGNPPMALVNEVTHEFRVLDGETSSLVHPLAEAWTKLRRRFSQPAATEAEVQRYLGQWR
ncbi:hypothetical protein [Sphingomonas psychrotolerans]|uniref:hypothetical protein n=1 Tax=Sphingomonas psychrotolerans TaxID=1327635 RepID=UPI00130514BE|nr:hypothetical protein [Sphingomonas psychrotolerans]